MKYSSSKLPALLAFVFLCGTACQTSRIILYRGDSRFPPLDEGATVYVYIPRWDNSTQMIYKSGKIVATNTTEIYKEPPEAKLVSKGEIREPRDYDRNLMIIFTPPEAEDLEKTVREAMRLGANVIMMDTLSWWYKLDSEGKIVKRKVLVDKELVSDTWFEYRETGKAVYKEKYKYEDVCLGFHAPFAMLRVEELLD